MAPAANGCAARQTLISCRFRGPFAFTFPRPNPLRTLASLQPFGSHRGSLVFPSLLENDVSIICVRSTFAVGAALELEKREVQKSLGY